MLQYILEIPLPIYIERMVFFLLTHLIVWHLPQKLGERREKCLFFICDWKYRKGHKCGENKLFYIYIVKTKTKRIGSITSWWNLSMPLSHILNRIFSTEENPMDVINGTFQKGETQRKKQVKNVQTEEL